MKKILISILLVIIIVSAKAQSFDSDRVAFTNFIVRMYNNAPFENVKIVTDDNDTRFLISALFLDKSKYKTESVLNRVASVRGMSQVSRFFNGAMSYENTVIHTKEKSNGASDTEIITDIRENSVGHVKSLELLTNFTRKDGKQVFIFIKQLENSKEQNVPISVNR